MGACYDTRTLDGRLTRDQVKKRFAEIQQQDCYENGHSYSGTIGMARGIKFPNAPLFADFHAADEWIADHAQKWEEALAVQTFNKAGDPIWVIGAWCSS